MIKNLLFDLDNTFIKFDQDLFVVEYTKLLLKKFVPLGYDEKNFKDGLNYGLLAMINNDGTKSNRDAFFQTFSKYNGNRCYSELDKFDDFYRNEFCQIKKITKPIENANIITRKLKEEGYNLILATNPFFPLYAQVLRLNWANCSENDFSYITSYENCTFCKPNVNYFLEILNKFNLKKEETMMLGNDAKEDMIASKVGIDTFLLTTSLINKENININSFKSGSLIDAYNYIIKNK